MMRRLLFCMAVWLLVTPGRLGAQGNIDPSNDAIAPDAGPWMILAASYVGPEAPRLAHEMAAEIRTRFKMPAYVFNRGDEERRKQEFETQRIREQYDALNKLRRENNEAEVPIPRRLMPHIQEQCAV